MHETRINWPQFTILTANYKFPILCGVKQIRWEFVPKTN